MDDLSAKISSILSDPQTMEQIKGLGEMLNLSDNSASESANPQQNKTNSAGSANTASSLLSAISGTNTDTNTLNMLSRLVPLMSDMGKEDDTTRLLNSLRPFLSVERRSKLDSALRLLKIMKLLPLIKDVGILDSIF